MGIGGWCATEVVIGSERAGQPALSLGGYLIRGIVPLSGVVAEETDWYWYPRIPLGSISLVFGQAGIGKSTMMYDVLARASIGETMPNSVERPKPPHDIELARSLVVGTEDAPARVAQVLEKAGADLDNIAVIAQDQLPDPKRGPLEQTAFIEQQMRAFRCRVLYVDNVSEAMLGNTDSNNERSVRMALRPLDQLAKNLGAAVMMVTHPKKGAERYDVKEGISGSQAFTNLARSVLYVAPMPHSDLVGLAVAKSNYYPAHRINTLSYQVKSNVIAVRDGHEVLDIPWIEWRGTIPYTAQELSNLNAQYKAEIAKLAEGEAYGG